jgi:hypothetical protein
MSGVNRERRCGFVMLKKLPVEGAEIHISPLPSGLSRAIVSTTPGGALLAVRSLPAPTATRSGLSASFFRYWDSSRVPRPVWSTVKCTVAQRHLVNSQGGAPRRIEEEVGTCEIPVRLTCNVSAALMVEMVAEGAPVEEKEEAGAGRNRVPEYAPGLASWVGRE